MTKVLILGANGMLGASLMRLYSKSPDIEVVGTARNAASAELLPKVLHPKLRLNICAENHETVLALIAAERPEALINCIGIIKQRDEACQELPSIRINALFPHILAQYCSWFDTRLIHISTDCVFLGDQNASQGRYTEASLADAQDLYGRSKHMGEVRHQPHAITLRTSIIGHELNSARSLIDWFLSQDVAVRGFTKALFSGFPTVELGRIIRDYVLPNPELTGLYHVAAEPINKYRLLKLVAEAYGHDVNIIPDSSIVIDRALDGSRFRAATGYAPPQWSELVAFMQEHKFHT